MCGAKNKHVEEDLPFQIVELWRQWHATKDIVYRNKIFEFYFSWCRKVASSLFLKFRHAMLEWEDFVHLASLAMIQSINKYDPGRGVPFEQYAYIRIKGEILNAIKAYTKDSSQKKRSEDTLENIYATPPSEDGASDSFQVVVDAAIGLAFGKFLELGILGDAIDETSPHFFFDKHEINSTIVSLVEELDERPKYIIKAHYFQHLEFIEIAQLMGYSPSRICQLHKAGLNQLRLLFEERY